MVSRAIGPGRLTSVLSRRQVEPQQPAAERQSPHQSSHPSVLHCLGSLSPLVFLSPAAPPNCNVNTINKIQLILVLCQFNAIPKTFKLIKVPACKKLLMSFYLSDLIFEWVVWILKEMWFALRCARRGGLSDELRPAYCLSQAWPLSDPGSRQPIRHSDLPSKIIWHVGVYKKNNMNFTPRRNHGGTNHFICCASNDGMSVKRKCQSKICYSLYKKM